MFIYIHNLIYIEILSAYFLTYKYLMQCQFTVVTVSYPFINSKLKPRFDIQSALLALESSDRT